jgi:hypothetical protein
MTAGALVAACMALTGWWGCSTEVDLTAPYDSIPVVYGLLEVDADTQWVKINRTWLGDGNQLVAAQIPDSSEYPEGSVMAKIVELIPSESGEIVGNELATGVEWVLQDTVLENKSTDGIFFGPSQRVYYASMSERALREDRWYRLEALLPDGSELKATTTMVQSSAGSIERPPPNLSSYQMGFASVNPDGSATYPSFPFRWTSAPGASRYAASLKVNFQERYYADDELTLLDSVRDRTISLSLGTRQLNNPNNTQTLEESFSGERFYSELATRLEVNPRIRRVLGYYDGDTQIERALDFELQVANQDLAIYLDVNESTNSIVQERPLWTNVQGGIGLWASRTTLGVYNLGYLKQTMQHLQEGDLTAALNFCSPSPLSDYSCD